MMTKSVRKTDNFAKQFNNLKKTYKSLEKNHISKPESAAAAKFDAHRAKVFDFLDKTLDKESLGKKGLKDLLNFVVEDIYNHYQANEEIKKFGEAERKMDAKAQPLFVRGIGLLEKLSGQGNLHAASALADIYSSYGLVPPQTYRRNSKAIILYERVTKSNDVRFSSYAHMRIAVLYGGNNPEAELTDSQRSNAQRHIEIAVDKYDSPYGLLQLASWHHSGVVVEQDIDKSFSLLERAMKVMMKKPWDKEKHLLSEVYTQYGAYLVMGWGCKEDNAKGMRLLHEAIDMGNASAKEWLDIISQPATESEQPPVSETNAVNESGYNPMSSFAGKSKKARQEKAGKLVKNKAELEKLLKPLHDLIGVAPVKTQIEDLVYLAHANALRVSKGIELSVPLSMHAAFMGSPGTAKTTVARLYGKILHELGFLAQGHLVEASRNDLIGEYIGQTTPKVRGMIESARGGVLFIDEAYSLVQDGGHGWDFGHEALAELLMQMENCRENLVVIFAGYSEEMKMFLKTNPGLKSRVPNIVDFPDYSGDEMVKIFEKFCNDAKMTVTEAALERLGGYLRKLDKESVRRFGNGRGVRNIFEESLVLQAKRVVKERKTSKKALMTIEAQDITLPDDPGKGKLYVIRNKD
jgi:SpoVK/Ycf46/Vps4 family AAA+-type ATPase